MKRSLLSRRFGRALTAATPIVLVGMTAMIGVAAPVVIDLLDRKGDDLASISHPIEYSLLAFLAVSFALLIARTYFEYRKLTYNSELILGYWDTFNSPEMREARALAANVLKKNQSHFDPRDPDLKDVDDVLDFFESLAFYERGREVSAEAVHEEFHYWIRGYFSAASKYIHARQKDNSTDWEYIEDLFNVVSDIEEERALKKADRRLSPEQLREFLDGERDYRALAAPEKKAKR